MSETRMLRRMARHRTYSSWAKHMRKRGKRAAAKVLRVLRKRDTSDH